MGRAERVINQAQVTIANGASLSSAFAMGTGAILAIFLPAAFTGTTLTFQGSWDGTTFSNVYDDAGTEVSATVAVDRCVVTGGALEKLAGIPHLKIRSGTSGAPSNQGAARTVSIIAKG